MIATKWILASCLAMAATGFAKAPVFSSIYTDTSACKTFDPCEDSDEPCGGDGYVECQGPKDYYLYEWYSAVSTMRDVRIRRNDTWNVLIAPDSPQQVQTYGQKTEWRMADGVPFAVIQRVRECDPDVPKRCDEFLIVRGLRGFESLRKDVDARGRDANTVARAVADSGFLDRHEVSATLSVPSNPKDKK